LAPPGVIRIVLAGGGAIVGALELELLLLELLEPGEPQGSIATVWVSVLFGITISFDPGGIELLPDCATTAASEHDVTAIVSGLCCFGITTVLTPGLIRAVLTGSELELEEPPPLLPHAANPAALAQIIRAIARRLVGIRFFMLSSGGAGLQRCRAAGQASRRSSRSPGLPEIERV